MAYSSASCCELAQPGVWTVVAKEFGRKADTRNVVPKGAASTKTGGKQHGGGMALGRTGRKVCKKAVSRKEKVRRGRREGPGAYIYR